MSSLKMLAFAVLAVHSQCVSASVFRVTPYVQHPAKDAMTIKFLSDAEVPATVSWWPEGHPESTASENVTPRLAEELQYYGDQHDKQYLPVMTPWQYRLRITGLAPDTVYGYRVQLTDGPSYEKHFRTAPAEFRPVRFVCYSDSETQPSSNGDCVNWDDFRVDQDTTPTASRRYFVDQTASYASNLCTMVSRQPDFFVIAGDLAEAGSKQTHWDEFWRHNAGALNDPAGSIPILAALGNHEYAGYSSQNGEQGAKKFLSYFEFEPNGSPVDADQQQRFHRLDYGPVAVIFIDPNNGPDNEPPAGTAWSWAWEYSHPHPLDTNAQLYENRVVDSVDKSSRVPQFQEGSAQYRWLEEQLADAQTNKLFTFLVCHQCPFSAGYHGRASGEIGRGAEGENLSGVPTRGLTNLVFKYGVDGWICGHDEMYEHSQVQGEETLPDGTKRPMTLNVYDVGIGGDGLRGCRITAEPNPYEVFRAHVDAPEEYDANGTLVAGGKHYGHLEVNVDTNALGQWTATLTPAYNFVSSNALTGAISFERRVYADEIVVTNQTSETPEYWLDITVSGPGTVDLASQFVPSGNVVSVTATPSAGMKFWKWTGTGATAANRYRTNVDIPMTEATTLTANFYDPAQTPRIIRYVVPDGAGAKDGTSWENAYADITAAYNAVVANPSGGEVWIGKGRHALDAPLALVPHVSVRGGFAGNETLASQADPANNPTILSLTTYKRSTDKWKDSTPMWTGDDMLTFVEPNDYGDSDVQFTSGNAGSAFENIDGSLIGGNEFTGLDFFRFGVHVFRFTTRGTSPVVIRDCRMLCCGWVAEGIDSPLYVDNVPVELADCAFIGCRNAARVAADTTVTSNLFRRCRFYVGGQNWNVRDAPPRAGCLAIGGTAWAHIDHCWIEKGQENDGGGMGPGLTGGLIIAGSVGGLVEDTVIRRNVTTSRCLGAGFVLSQSSFVPVTFNRCRFEKNRYSGKGVDDAHGGIGCAVGINGNGCVNFNDCAFVGNAVTNATVGCPAGSVLGGKGDFYGNFANCIFEDNISTGRATRTTFASSWQHSKRFAFANCVFRNNLNGYMNGDAFVRRPEFRELTFNENQMFTLVNCVLENDDAEYQPFGTVWTSWANYFAFASCVSSSSQTWGTPSGTGQFRYGPLDSATLVPLKDALEMKGVVVSRGIEKTSDYRKRGIPVYRAADGDLFIYDTTYNAGKPWRLLRNPTAVYTAEEGGAKGLSLAAPIADAFGRPRNGRWFALGPLVPAPFGSVISLR